MKAAAARHPLLPGKAVIERVTPEGPECVSLLLRPEGGFRFRCGQFLVVQAPGAGEAPFAPSSPDGFSDTVQVTVLKTGAVTSALHALEPGAVLGLRGPYGRPFPFESFAGKDLLVVVQGMGAAAARPFLMRIREDRPSFNGVSFGLAAGTAGDRRPFEGETEGLAGSMEVFPWHDGLAASFRGAAAALLFGSSAFLSACGAALREAGLDASSVFLWTERRIVCGIGHCLHCSAGAALVCREGPLLPLSVLGRSPGDCA